MRILLATDAWTPQVNGVVRTWQHVIRELEAMGHEVAIAHPGLGRTIAAPRYNEIRLALRPMRIVKQLCASFAPQAIHIATEGPIGMAASRWCRARKRPFTTSYHTQFPQYLRRYFAIPEALTWAFLRRHHGRAARTFAPTQAITDELHARGIERATTWCRGVDREQFAPDEREPYQGLARPIMLYAGRVAVEKNIEAFLDLDIPGTKVVVGDGPLREHLERTRRDVVFAGYRFGADLARHYAGADVFVFPSRTDTFGIVMLEANACGVPVAAYPVAGPIDVVNRGVNGWIDEDLAVAVKRALEIDRASCIAHARANSWRRCAEMLFDGLVPSALGSSQPMSVDRTIDHCSRPSQAR